jgi:hypothetical protein
MSAAQQLNYVVNAAAYLLAAKKGINEKSEEVGDNDNRDDNGADYDIVVRQSKSTRRQNTSSSSSSSSQRRSSERRNQQKKQENFQEAQPEVQSEPKDNSKNRKLTKRQQVLQNYADQEAAGAVSILASIADAAVTRSQTRNQNKVAWTEKDRAAASRAAAIALEVATEAAEAAQGKKKKEQPAPYWTRLHEKNRSNVRFQKEIGHVFECDFY